MEMQRWSGARSRSGSQLIWDDVTHRHTVRQTNPCIKLCATINNSYIIPGPQFHISDGARPPDYFSGPGSTLLAGGPRGRQVFARVGRPATDRRLLFSRIGRPDRGRLLFSRVGRSQTSPRIAPHNWTCNAATPQGSFMLLFLNFGGQLLLVRNNISMTYI